VYSTKQSLSFSGFRLLAVASIFDHHINPSKGLIDPIDCGVGNPPVGDIELEREGRKKFEFSSPSRSSRPFSPHIATLEAC
jgi:hypothetical protein